jgi:hypothetical protein
MISCRASAVVCIDKTVLHYAATRSSETLREHLKRAAIRDRDLEIEATLEWAAADPEDASRAGDSE